MHFTLKSRVFDGDSCSQASLSSEKPSFFFKSLFESLGLFLHELEAPMHCFITIALNNKKFTKHSPTQSTSRLTIKTRECHLCHVPHFPFHMPHNLMQH